MVFVDTIKFFQLYLDCIRDNTYPFGTVHKEHVDVQTAIQCLDECNKDNKCKFWHMYNQNCKLFSGHRWGLQSGYGGALAGRKNCFLQEKSPKGIYFIENYR